MFTQHIKNYSNNIGANTFIEKGGIKAFSRNELANILGVNNLRIKAFKIDASDNISFYIKDSYFFYAGLANNFQSSDVKSFTDVDGLVTRFGTNAFAKTPIETVDAVNVTRIDGINTGAVGSFNECTKLTSINSQKITYIGFYGFRNNYKLLEFYSDELTYLGYSAFNNCYKVVFSNGGNFNKVTTILDGAFTNCREATGYSFNSLTSIGSGNSGMFRNNYKATYYNFPLLVTAGDALAYQGFSDNLLLPSLYFPELTTLNCTNTKSNPTLGFMRNTPLLTTFSAPKLETITGNGFFQEAIGLELCDMKKCKDITPAGAGTSPSIEVSGLKTGCVINVHIDCKTSGVGGVPNLVLQATKDLRSAMVNFYNTDGTYNSTL